MRRFANGFAELKGLIERPYDESVFRRAVILLALVIPAFAANMLVHYGAAAFLAPDQFGIFFVANAMSNVLFSGSFVLNMVFTRYLVSVELQHSPKAIYFGLRRLELAVLTWGAIGAATCFALLSVVGQRVGAQSTAVIFLVVFDVYTAYVADLGRILLQSLRRTAALGLYTLVWMLLRFLLCMAGLLIFRTVWGGFIGIVASAVIMFLALHLWVAKQTRDLQFEVSSPPSLLAMSPVAIGYGLTITVSNLDVLVSYFLLSGDDLGVYSASSVFPKAIIVVVMPLLQMLFPIAMGANLSGRQYHAILAKSAIVLLAVTACGSIATWALSDLLCGGTWGIKNCKTGILDVLLWSVVPIAFLRALVLLQFALELDYLAICLGVPALIYTWIAFTSEHSVAFIARQFSLFAAAVFIFLGAVHLVARMHNLRTRFRLGKQ